MKVKAERVIKKCPKIRKDIRGKTWKQAQPKTDKKKTRTGFKKSRTHILAGIAIETVNKKKHNL
jgi:hypothetical protein